MVRRGELFWAGYFFCVLPGFFWIPIDDALQELFVQVLCRQKVVGCQMGLSEMPTHLIRDGPVEIGEDVIACRYRDGYMEPDVGGDGLLDVARKRGGFSLFQ